MGLVLGDAVSDVVQIMHDVARGWGVWMGRVLRTCDIRNERGGAEMKGEAMESSEGEYVCKDTCARIRVQGCVCKDMCARIRVQGYVCKDMCARTCRCIFFLLIEKKS